MYVPGNCLFSCLPVKLSAMSERFSSSITCAYLYPITRYGYPPDVSKTNAHLEEMAGMGFNSLELEGIGGDNIRYLHKHRKQLADKVKELGCTIPVYCVVLPALASADPERQKEALAFFEMGCETARALGATAVLDNGPLLPLEFPAEAPVKRHYDDKYLASLGLPAGFSWDEYELRLTRTYQQACSIAEHYGLDYHLHPCEGSMITNTDSFLHFADKVNADNLLFNLDTANQFFFRDNLVISLLRLRNRIGYVHLSDNRGTRVEHLVPGEGSIHWDSFFSTLKAIGFNGHYGIDVGGAETPITDIKAAYLRSAQWLEEQLTAYSLMN